MHYSIHRSELPGVTNTELVGIEVQGPLTDLAVTGLASALCLKADGYSPAAHVAGPVAKSVNLTRSDVDGTALIIEPGYSRSSMPAPERVARVIATLIDPAGLHTIDHHPTLPEAVS